MITTINDTGHKAFVADAAIAQGLRVKVTTEGHVDIAGATDIAIGVAEFAAASGGIVTVKLWSAPGTFLCKANSSWTIGTQLYPAASGLVDDAGTTKIGLVCLQAATAQNDLIECAKMELGA